MLLDWAKKSDFSTELSAQALHDSIISNLTRSHLEIVSAESGYDSFRILAALKSKRIYLHSSEGKSTNFGSVRSEFKYGDGTLTVFTRNPPVIVILQLFVIIVFSRLEYALFIMGHRTVPELLFPIICIITFCWLNLFAAERCHKEAVRVVNFVLNVP